MITQFWKRISLNYNFLSLYLDKDIIKLQFWKRIFNRGSVNKDCGIDRNMYSANEQILTSYEIRFALEMLDEKMSSLQSVL